MTKLKSIEMHNLVAQENNNNYKPSGIQCPRCEYEMTWGGKYKLPSDSFYGEDRPKREVYCEACSYSTYVLV